MYIFLFNYVNATQSRTALIAFPISIILIIFAKKHFNKNLIIWFFLAISGFFYWGYIKGEHRT